MPSNFDSIKTINAAEAQSKLLKKFHDDFALSSTEQAVLARGRNASLTARKKGKGGESMYQDSTAFEALLGYTYISDKVRFIEMMSWMKLELDKTDGY
jgi:23S rRNA maturation mini-RNase III